MKKQEFKEIEVNDPVKVKVLNKYWVRGTVIVLDESDMATVRVPAYYGYSDAFIVKDKKENLQPILLKKERL